MEIKYHPLVARIDIPKLDKSIRHRISDAIHDKLGTRPDLFGIPLRQPLQNLRKVRAGDYRIVFLLQKETVFIVAIAHRKDIYKLTGRRVL